MDSKDKVSELEDWSKAMEERFKDPLSAELISILVTMLKEIKAGAEFESNKMDQNDAKVKKFCDLERKLIEAMKELNKKAEIFDADKDDGYSTKETGKALDAKAQLLAGVGEDVNGNKVDNYDANVKLLEQCLNQENCCDSGRKLMEQMKEINKT
ncbi:hypothetical protein A2U01_0003214, partial [Trifolium medium]|nr:hypothetical protein [Trifolium medium]